MPILRTHGKLMLFAHVPKCAGTSIEGYLGRRFGRHALAFLDSGHYSQPPALRWSQSSPQHIDAVSLRWLFPESFFDASFAMVRHPAARLRSVFLFQRDIERRLPSNSSFSAWLETIPDSWDRGPWALDNHTRPMSEIVPEEAEVFHLEAGTAPLVAWLDDQVGNTKGERKIAARHSFSDRLEATGHTAGPDVKLSRADCAWIATLYGEDYARFGYEEDPAKAPLQKAPQQKDKT